MNRRRKNSKKAINPDGSIKPEYSLTLNGISLGLLSEKGNYMNKTTKNGATRLRKINKTEENRNNYIDFYKKIMDGDNHNQKEHKVENISLGQVPKEHKKHHSKKHVKEMQEDMKKGVSFQKAHKKAVKKVGMGYKQKKNISLGVQDRPDEIMPKLKKRTLDTSTADIRTTKREQERMSSDNKKDTGFPHQKIIDRVVAPFSLDFTRYYDEAKEENIKISESLDKINELIEANQVLSTIKIISKKNNLKSVKEYYVLKAIVEIDRENNRLNKKKEDQKQEQKPNLRAGLVVDLQALLGVPDINIEAFKNMLKNNGVFAENIQQMGDPIERPKPQRDVPNRQPNKKLQPKDINQYVNSFAPQKQDDEAIMLGDLSKKEVKRFDTDAYYTEAKAVRQFSNKNKVEEQFKSTFKFRIKPKKEKKKRRTFF